MCLIRKRHKREKGGKHNSKGITNTMTSITERRERDRRWKENSDWPMKVQLSITTIQKRSPCLSASWTGKMRKWSKMSSVSTPTKIRLTNLIITVTPIENVCVSSAGVNVNFNDANMEIQPSQKASVRPRDNYKEITTI